MKRTALLLLAIRVGMLALVVTVGVLVFGPFGGAESRFGLTDKEAHALAFYTLQTLGLLAAPRMRKWDLVVIMMIAGGLIEIIQPYVGRDGDIMDWLADLGGISLAIAPLVLQNLRNAMAQQLPRTPKRRRSDHRRLAYVHPSLRKAPLREPAIGA